MRVLVVEDEPKMATLVARGLREEGHAADIAAHGEDALWMANAAPYDAIVLDVMLPGLDDNRRPSVDALGSGATDSDRSHGLIRDLLGALEPVEPQPPGEQLELAGYGRARALFPDHTVAPFHFVMVGTGTLGRIAQRPHLGCGKAAARYYSPGAMFWLMRKKLSGS